MKKSGLNAKYSRILNNINCIVIEVDFNGIITYANPYAYIFFGYKEGVLTGAEITATVFSNNFIFDDSELKRLKKYFTDNELPSYFENEIHARTGENKWISWDTEKIYDDSQQLLLTVMVGKDITRIKRIEEELRLRSLILENINDAVAFANEKGELLYLNKSSKKLIKPGEEKFQGKKPPDIIKKVVSAEDNVEDKMISSFNNGELYRGNIGIEIEQGKTCVFDTIIKPLYIDDDKLAGHISVCRDITEKVETQKQLEERENELLNKTAIFKHSDDAIIINDSQGKIIDFNPAAEKLFVMSKSDVLNKSFFSLPKYVENLHQKKKNLESFLESVQSFKDEIEIRLHNGTVKNIDIIYIPFFGKNGALIGFVSICRDITEEKITKDKLDKTLKELYKKSLIFNNLSDAAVVFDQEGHVVDSNPAFKEMFGYSTKGIKKKSAGDLFSDKYNDFNTVKEIINAFNAGKTFRGSLWIPKKNGQTCYSDTILLPLNNEKGEYLGNIGVIKDITAEKHAEEDVLKSEEKFRAVVENALDGIIISKVANYSKIEYANDVIIKLLGYEQCEFMSLSPIDLFADTPMGKEMILQRINDRENENHVPVQGESQFITKNGKIINVLISSNISNINNEPHFIVFIKDITDWKQARTELEKSEKKYRAVVENALEGVVLVSVRDYILTFANDYVCELLKYDKSEAIGMCAFDFYSKKSREMMEKRYEEAKAGHEYDKVVELEVKAKDGELFDVILSSEIHNFDGERYFIGFIKDISDRKKAERELQNSERKLRTVIDNSLDGIIFLDYQDFNITFSNPVFAKMVGYKQEEIINQSPLKFFTDNEKGRELIKYRREATLRGEAVPREFETQLLTKKGKVIHVLISSSKNVIDNKEITVKFIKDISRRKQIETTLKKREAQYRGIVEDQMELVLRFTAKGKLTFVNEAASRYFGKSKEKLIGTRFFEYLIDDNSKNIKKYLSNITPDNVVCRREGRIQLQEGEIRWIQWSDRGVFDEKDHVIEYQSVGRDITERKNAEEELRLFKAIIESSQEGIAITDNDGNLIYANPATEKLFKADRKNIHSIDYMDFFTPKSKEILQTKVRPNLEKGKSWEGELNVVDTNGHEFTIWQRTDTVRDEKGNVIYRFGLMHDITDRKKAEIALKESEERLKFAIEAANDGLWDYNLITGKVYRSPRYFTMLGYKPDFLPPTMQSWVDLLHPEDREPAMTALENEILSGCQIYEDEFRLKANSGKYICILAKGKVVDYDDSGNPIRIVGTHTDITERKKAEHALKQSEEQYRAIVNDQTELICRFDINAKFTFVNQALCRYVNISKEKLLGANLVDRIPDNDKELVRMSVRNLRPENPVTFLEISMRLAQDKLAYQHWIIRGLFDGQGNIKQYQAVGRDITERKKAEEERELLILELERTNQELKKLSKMKDDFLSIASHDLRSPFMTISAIADILLKEGGLDKEYKRYIEMIKSNSTIQLKYVNDILDVIKLETGKIRLDIKEHYINKTIKYCIANHEILARKKGIDLKTYIKTDTKMLYDNAKIIQVLNNLITNAIKFTPVGGYVSIWCFENKNNEIEVHVKDNGLGISSENKEKLFQIYQLVNTQGTQGEPGSGFGLSICKNFVELHGGSIGFSSEEGEGSDFYFALPIKK